jgi:DNA ligase (NAD+)
MDIEGLGGETVALLFNNGLVKDYADLYELTVEQILPLERMAQKSAENLINGVQKSKEVPFERVLYAIGIRYVGETVAKKLAQHFQNIDRLMQAELESLNSIHEIGDKIAIQVSNFFKDEINLRIVEKLKLRGLQMAIVEEIGVIRTSKLAGKSFLVSGVFSRSRDEIKKQIEHNGGRNVSAVSAKLDYLLAGDKMGPEKLKKANELNITIIDEAAFEELLQQIL